jgi:TRAP-type C4-dicarboxylate transport system substrate-binding protein
MRYRRLVAWSCAALFAAGTAAADDVTLRAASFLNPNLNLTKDFLQFVEKANAALGKGASIKYLGAAEVVPIDKQPQALQRDVLDLLYTNPSRFAGSVPEGDVLLGTNKPIDELRASGAIDALNARFEKKAGARILAVHHQGLVYNLYFTQAPKFAADGMPDLSGLKIRTSPTYRELLVKLGATPVSVPTNEVYTAIERGVATGMGWPAIDIISTGLHKLLKYRIEPGFFNGANFTVISVKAWNGLSKEAQAALTKTALEHERVSVALAKQWMTEEATAMQQAGVKFVSVPTPAAAAKFRQAAFDTVWERMKERKVEGLEALRKQFYTE